MLCWCNIEVKGVVGAGVCGVCRCEGECVGEKVQQKCLGVSSRRLRAAKSKLTGLCRFDCGCQTGRVQRCAVLCCDGLGCDVLAILYREVGAASLHPPSLPILRLIYCTVTSVESANHRNVFYFPSSNN